MLRPNSKYAAYSLMSSIIALGLMLPTFFSSSIKSLPFIFDMGFLLLGISFILSSNTEINNKKSFYIYLICGTVIIVVSLLNIYKQL
ncbi:hypothetical protein [Psychrobacillus vulpis]|uniref:DUF3953 domain-containing protein n=1 Tax=Psychrobacillus vulpis TaxID=2325572 RepID=A0A544TPU0_9BACI|nr:hypothetical protein [Psychrobacillus vulpis]TQR19439.1 hypothetical protein FG384_12370 [Psychrobacillus vulpis]